MRTPHTRPSHIATDSDSGHTRTIRDRSALERRSVLRESEVSNTAGSIVQGGDGSGSRAMALAAVALVAVAVGGAGQLLPSRSGWAGLAATVAALGSAWLAQRVAKRRTSVVPPIAAAFAGAAGLIAWARPAGPLLALVGVGLGAAAAVDLVEHRIPTPVAHATTAVSLLGMSLAAMATGAWPALAAAIAATGVVVAVYAVLWLVGGVGFGDVRLAAATLTAGTGGIAYVSGMLVVPLTIVGIAGLAQVVVRRRGELPLGPAIVAAWMVQVWGP